MADVNELICEAIDTIVKERINSVQFDRTILCSIVDASEAEKGKYIVATISSSLNTVDKEDFNEEEEYLNAMARISTTFDAYSAEKYTSGQYVYVLIPNGDFSQQKTIVGKYITDEDEPYQVVSPFDSFIDMTGNLLDESSTGTFSLVANSDKQIANKGNAMNNDPTLEIAFKTPLIAFTRLGIRAKFSTKLSQQKCIAGSYGIQVVLTIKDVAQDDDGKKDESIESDSTDKNDENIETNDTDKGIKSVIFDLNSSNFVGNPYSFEGFYNQELVFDISAYQQIISAKVFFYQSQGSFKNNEYLDLSWQDEFGNTIEPNLFVKDIYLAIGYGEEDVGKDTLFLYTLDETSYEQTFDPIEHKPVDMTRTLKVRWVHQDEKTGKYETVSDFSALHTSEKTSAILNADTALYQAGLALEDNTKLKISTSFYKSYLNIMKPFINGTAKGMNIGEKFDYVLRTNPNGTVMNASMTANIRESFIDDLEQQIKDRFAILNIYTWMQEQAHSFNPETKINDNEDNQNENEDENAISRYYEDGTALTKDPPYYKYRYELYNNEPAGQFAKSLAAFESGGEGLNKIEQDKIFLIPANLNDGTEIFIVLKMPDNFASNCVIPFWRDTIQSLRNSIKTAYDREQSIVSSYQYELRWYHYRLGATISNSDVYAGANWRRIDKDFLTDETLLNPDPKSLTNQAEFTFTPNPNKRQEQFKCILLIGYNKDQDGNERVFNFISSKIFTFVNRGKVIDVDTIEKVEALSIYCRDNTFGNYFIYNLGGDVTNTTEPEKIRHLEAYFNPSEELTASGPLREAQTITWTFPLDNFSYEDATGKIQTISGYTMLQPEISIQDIVAQTNNGMYSLDTDNLLEKVYNRKIQRYQYDKVGDVVDSYPDVFKIDIAGQKIIYTYKCFRDGSIFNSFGYKIKSYYTQQNTVNNTIGCSIVKDFISYNAVKAFNFGPSGTQGAEVTLAVNFNRDKDTLYNAVTQIENINNEGIFTVTQNDFRPARFSAFLYDADSNLVDISGALITCQWAECVSQYKNVLDRWFIIEECREGNEWIDNIPTWEIHYKQEYKDKKMDNPKLEELTSSSPTEAVDLVHSIQDARINAIVEITISNYGRYDKLKTFLGIPQKTIYHYTNTNNTDENDNKDINLIPGYISGPTQVIYDGTGHCDYYKGPYTMTAFIQGEWKNNIAGNWELIYPSDADKVDSNYLPALESAVLKPLGMYIEDAPRYGIAFSSDAFNLQSDAVGKTFFVRDLANGDVIVERLMTQELWDYIQDFVNTPVNKLKEKNFTCSFTPPDNYNKFTWNPDRSEYSQLVANLLHGIFPHVSDIYSLYQGFIDGNGKTYGWRLNCSTAQDPYTGQRYYYQLIFTKNFNNVQNPKDEYNETSDPNSAADFLQGFLSYFKSVQLHIGETTNCWYQPIYVGQNRYMSATLNKWDGQSLLIDEKNCEIVAHAVAAGKKEKGPAGGADVFTGVVIGQMSDSSGELSKHTGVYGINQGAMAYQFLDDGTGFIGKTGRGRIVFDGNTGVIKSGLYDNQANDKIPIGSIIDFDDGRIELHGHSSSTSWNYGNSSTTSNQLVLPNASKPLSLQSGPSFGGTESNQESGETTPTTNGASDLISAVFNSNRLTITVRKNYLYNNMSAFQGSIPKWKEEFTPNLSDDKTDNDGYKLIALIGKTIPPDAENETLMPLLLKCVPMDDSIDNYIAEINYSSPLIEYEAAKTPEEKDPINTINFSSTLEMFLEEFKINYHLCGQDRLWDSILFNTPNTENYESEEEKGQKLDTSVTNSYKTYFKRKMNFSTDKIYGVAFEIPIKETFYRFFEELGNALSATLTFTVSLTKRTVFSASSEGNNIEAVGALILDAGHLYISKEEADFPNDEPLEPPVYKSSGTPFSVGIIHRDSTDGEIKQDINFSVDWNGTMHARNGYFENQSGDYYIKISSSPSEDYPFKIGYDRDEKFKVQWDGTVWANDGHFENGEFEGRIESRDGLIGGWTIDRNHLSCQGDQITLDAKNGVINGPVLRGADIRGGTIFSNDLHVNYFTIYNWDKINKNDSDIASTLVRYGLQGRYSVDDGLYPSNRNAFVRAIEDVKIGQIGLIRSYDGKNTTYPLGITALKGSIVLQVDPNNETGSTENIRLSVPQSGSIIAQVFDGTYITKSVGVLGARGIQWGPDWGKDIFSILDEKYITSPTDYTPSTSPEWIGTFQRLKQLIFDIVKDIIIKGDPNGSTTLQIKNIPAEKQTGIYARFA